MTVYAFFHVYDSVNATTSSETTSGKTRATKVGSKRGLEASSGDGAKGASTGGAPATQLSTESSHMILQVRPYIYIWLHILLGSFLPMC